MQSNGDVSASLTVQADNWPVTVNAAAVALLTASDEKDLGSCCLQPLLLVSPPWASLSAVEPLAGCMQVGDDSSNAGAEDGSTEVKRTENSRTFKVGHRICRQAKGTPRLSNLSSSSLGSARDLMLSPSARMGQNMPAMSSSLLHPPRRNGMRPTLTVWQPPKLRWATPSLWDAAMNSLFSSPSSVMLRITAYNLLCWHC